MSTEAESSDHLMATCFHEAGHAVIAHTLGFDVSAVYFLADGSGEIRLDPRRSIRPTPHASEQNVRSKSPSPDP